MPGKVLVGYLDDDRGRDALALGRIMAEALGAELAVATVAGAEELAAEVRRQGAELIVLGSTHRGPVGRILAGGTTMQRVLAGASCTIAVAPHGFAARADGEAGWNPLDGDGEDTGMRVIGVGWDGSPGSRAALAYATDLAERNGASLRVYSVVRNTVPTGGPGTTVAPVPIQDAERSRTELRAATAELPPEVRALPVLLRGFPVEQLLKAARIGVDLLVLGTVPRGHVGRLLHKSVAGEVALAAPCPVLICPAPVGVPVMA